MSNNQVIHTKSNSSVNLGEVLNSRNFTKFNNEIEQNKLPVFMCDPVDLGNQVEPDSCKSHDFTHATFKAKKRWSTI